MSLNLEVISDGIPKLEDVYRPPSPFAPFDCTGVSVIAPDLGRE